MNKYKTLHLKFVTFILTLIMTIGMIYIGEAKDTYAAYKRYVTASSLAIRTKASSSSKKVGSYKKGKKITCYGKKGSWTKVKYKGKTRYVYTKYLSKSKPKKVTGSQVATYAKKFVGNPYKYGGTSLTKGADCSGFVMSIYKHFGYKLPHSSSEIATKGKKVSWSKKKPGDVICYYGHVAIYIGNNKIVHASSSKTGIKISNKANYRKVRCVRRILK